LRFIEELPALSILAFGSDEAIRAGRVAKKFSDLALTLAGAHGLVVMEERRIVTCWSTDRHLGLTGVALVI
jgi:hypothetical protein